MALLGFMASSGCGTSDDENGAVEGVTATVTTKNFDEVVLQNKQPVLVDFWAPSCVPCKMMDPSLRKLAGAMKDKAVVAKINIDTNQQLAQRYGVRSIPCLLVFKNGAEVERFVGLTPYRELAAALRDAAE